MAAYFNAGNTAVPAPEPFELNVTAEGVVSPWLMMNATTRILELVTADTRLESVCEAAIEAYALFRPSPDSEVAI